MVQDLLPESVQAHLTTHVTAGLNVPQATADSKAGPMQAASLREVAAAVEEGEEFPAVFPVRASEAALVVIEEGSMVEGVVRGNSSQCHNETSLSYSGFIA
jgi:hypothetical protein